MYNRNPGGRNSRASNLPPIRSRKKVVSADHRADSDGVARPVPTSNDSGVAEDGSTQGIPSNQRGYKRGFYSERIAGYTGEFQDEGNGAIPHSVAAHASALQGSLNVPQVLQFEGPDNFQANLRRATDTATAKFVDPTPFPLESRRPKVILPKETMPGVEPREVRIDRLRRSYLTIDINKLLEERKVDMGDVIPGDSRKVRGLLNAAAQYHDGVGCRSFPPYLDLHFFDNTEFDCHPPKKWMELGQVTVNTAHGEVKEQRPLPAKAYLPFTKNPVPPSGPRPDSASRRPRQNAGRFDRPLARTGSGENSYLNGAPVTCCWSMVAVFHYDEERNEFLVGRIDDRGCPLVTANLETMKDRAGKDGVFYWVRRLFLLFDAEDPVTFADRFADADRRRRLVEALIRYHLYIDCMPTNGLPQLPRDSLSRMVHTAVNTPGLQQTPKSEDFVLRLSRQITLDYQRSMAKMLFDDVVTAKPEAYPYVNMPPVEEVKVPEQGKLDIEGNNFADMAGQMKFRTLLVNVGAQQVLCALSTECNAAGDCRLFQTGLTKTMRIIEFEQMQSQACVQVQTYLSETLVVHLRNSIRHSLRDVGKGWFNTFEASREVYMESKLRKLMGVVKFAMQVSGKHADITQGTIATGFANGVHVDSFITLVKRCMEDHKQNPRYGTCSW